MADDSDPTTAALSLRFGRRLTPDVAGELASMLRLYSIPTEELFFKWEAYCIKLDLDLDIKIGMDVVRDFKRDLQQVLEAEVRGKLKPAGGASMGGGARTVKTSGIGGEGLGLCVFSSRDWWG